MQIVVTGASSLLGQSLLRGLIVKATLLGVDGPSPIRRILAVDRTQDAELFLDERIEYVRGEFEQPRFLARMMGIATDGIFHLAALGLGTEGETESAPEEDLEADLTRTWDGTRALLDACRFQSAVPKLVLASTVEAAGRADCTGSGLSRAGALAAMCELLVAEGARRGIARTRCVRLGNLDAAESAADAVARLIEAHEAIR